MQFPNMVYKGSGPHQRKGGTFDTRGVKHQADLDAALKDGWFRTLPEAISGQHDVIEESKDDDNTDSLGDNQAPTRAELEAKAKDLHIKFTKKTSDEDLAKQIEEALKS